MLVARFYGARHADDVEKTVHSALLVSIAAGVLLLLIGLLGSPALLHLLNTKEDLYPGAVLYLRVYFLGMPALALYNYGNAIFSAIGETKKPLYYLCIAGALNILLNLFFVIVCHLDVVGVALASAISQCVSAFLVLRALTRVQDCYALDFHKVALDPATTQRQRLDHIAQVLDSRWACLPGSRTPSSPLQTSSFRPVSTPLTPSWSRATPPPPTPTI